MIILQEGIYFGILLFNIGKFLAFVVLPVLVIIFYFIFRNKQKKKAPYLLARDYIMIILKAALTSILIIISISVLILVLFAISVRSMD